MVISWLADFFLTSHPLCFFHPVMMLILEASDGSVILLSLHLFLQHNHSPSLCLSSSQSDPQCPVCLKLTSCRIWVGKYRVSSCALPYQRTQGHLEKMGQGQSGGWQGQLPCQGSPPHPISVPSYAVPFPTVRQ